VKCPSCGFVVDERRDHVYEVYVPMGRLGRKKWKRSLPVTKAEAESQIHELRATGYEARAIKIGRRK
jgi:hypothetical protein